MRRPETDSRKLNKIATAVLLAVSLAAPPTARADRLTRETEEAFVRYIRVSEAWMDLEIARRSDFLWIDALPQSERDQAASDLKNGRVLIKQDFISNTPQTVSVPGGLIHDWTGIVFVPGVSMSELISTLQDYDQSARRYSPQVLKSKLLEHSGNDFRVFLRLKQVYVITVVLDTEYQVHYTFLDPAHVISRSYSTRIAEVENAGEPQEREMPVGDDGGFLWRLYSYWRFYESRDGVYVQCNAVSLTRDVPTGLGWLIQPFLKTIPRDSLRFTLESTRTALIHDVQGQLSPNTSSTGEQEHEH
jgi:hypothetical protein